MNAKTEILTPLQKELLSALFSDPWFRRYFYLTGGTALSAFYLYHRLSDDLDFFSHDTELAPVPKLLGGAAKKLNIEFKPVQTAPGFMRFFLGEQLKIDVVADVGFRVGAPELIEDYMVDSFKNIAINKVCALLGRLDAKDYIDLYFILHHEKLDIFELLSLAQKKDAGLEPFVWASLIADVERLTLLPRMLKPVSLKELKKFYLALRDQILDRIRPPR